MAFLVSIGLAAVLFYVLQNRIREQGGRIDRLYEEIHRLRFEVARRERQAEVAPESPPAPKEAAPAPEPRPEASESPETIAAAAPVPVPLNVSEAPIPSPPPPPAPPEGLPAPAAPPVPPVETAVTAPPARQVSLEERLG